MRRMPEDDDTIFTCTKLKINPKKYLYPIFRTYNPNKSSSSSYPVVVFKVLLLSRTLG